MMIKGGPLLHKINGEWGSFASYCGAKIDVGEI